MNELSVKTTDFPTAEAFDALMRSQFDKQQLAVHLDGPTFGERMYTQGTLEWGDSPDIRDNPGFRIKNWTFDSQSGVILTWDHSKIAPTPIPIALIRTTTMAKDLARLNLHTAEEVWAGQARGQTVRDLQFDLQFEQAVPKWRAAGVMLRIGAVALGGHQAAIERCHVMNYGAYRYEGFPLYIQGAYDMYDRNLIATLDPTTHIYDEGVTDSECSHITDCLADGYVELHDVGDQVTVRAIIGSMGEKVPGVWQQHDRAYSYQRGNHTVASGSNAVQGHTAYNSLRADIDHNTSDGAAVGVYGDFCRNKGLHIWENQFLACDYAGIRFFLSPTGPGNVAEQFSHEDYDIGPNKITSRSGVQVDLGTFEAPMTSGSKQDFLPLSPTRYIRNIRVDASLLLEAKGTIPGIVRTGQVVASNKGCGRFNPFKR